MLLIRAEQMADLSQYSVRNFEYRMVQHLKDHFPQEALRAGPDRMLTSIRQGIGQARSYGFTTEMEIAQFLSLTTALGADFGKANRFPRMKGILARPDLPPSKRVAASLAYAARPPEVRLADAPKPEEPRSITVSSDDPRRLSMTRLLRALLAENPDLKALATMLGRPREKSAGREKGKASRRFSPRDPRFSEAVLIVETSTSAGIEDKAHHVDLAIRSNANITLGDLKPSFGEWQRLEAGPGGEAMVRFIVADPNLFARAFLDATLAAEPKDATAQVQKLRFSRVEPIELK